MGLRPTILEKSEILGIKVDICSIMCVLYVLM
jgi:hypothetical protein